uniref:CYtochrome P450 family n=1 Tax=Ditylenchus dipsaci TaxID=166011 RepID=A0A915ED05_9BILA
MVLADKQRAASPIPWPILGNLPEIGANPPGYDTYLKWRQEYGPIFTYWLGEKPTVAIAEYSLMNETIVKDGDSYADRDFFNEWLYLIRGPDGLATMGGETWKEHRKFFMQVMRNLGVGRNVLEEKIEAEFTAVCANIDRMVESGDGEDVDIGPEFDVCVGSMINSLLFGYSFNGARSDEFTHLRAILNDYMTLVGKPSSQFLMTFPHLVKDLPYFSGIFKTFKLFIAKTYKFFDQQIEKHKSMAQKEVHEESTHMDYVSAFMQEMKLRDGQDCFDMPTLYSHLLDFWIAGQETTTNTLNWGVIHLLYNPDVQTKLHAELDSVIQTNRFIHLADRPRLPYATAVVNEIQRIANVLPQNLARCNTKDVVVNGHFLPKGTSIMPLMSCVLYDEKIFPESRKFKPERFLTADEKSKRVCVGESLAKTEIFLILINLFHQYKLSMPIQAPPPSMQQNFGLSVVPLPYKCQIKRRTFQQ